MSLRTEHDLTETAVVAPARARLTRGRPLETAAPARRSSLDALAPWALGLVVAVGCILRFWPASDLWLDEALSVNIARLPLSQLVEALRHDGSPPLYYLALHLWTAVFGTGDWAVRALSGVVSLATLPLAWAIGKRMGGRGLAWATVVVLATSPFALRFATETRMYALVTLLAVAGHLLLLRALERPTLGRLAALSAVAAGLVYTHYWALFLIAATVVALLVVVWRRRSRAALRCVVAITAGAVPLLPWLPVLLYQLQHTGAPWAINPEPAVLARQVDTYAGGETNAGAFLGLALVLLFGLGLFGRRRGDILQLTIPPTAMAVAAGVMAGALVLGFATAYPTSGAYADRYTAVALGLFVLVVARGAIVAPRHGVRYAALGICASLGLVAGHQMIAAPRTEATLIAATLEHEAAPGDVIGYCPADLAPSLDRLLPDGRFQQVVFPPGGGDAKFVDWVDFLHRQRTADLTAFAADLVDRAGPDHRVFMVWTPAHGPLGARCAPLLHELEAHRTRVKVLTREDRFQERASLTRFDP